MVDDEAALSPDEAFAALADERRLDILRTLGEATVPLNFTELRDRVGVAPGGNFNYHLDKLVGHFVRKGRDGYALTRPGERVLQATLSGAVARDPVVEPTATSLTCWYCGAPVEVSYQNERATAYCTECDGTYGTPVGPDDRSRIGYMYLPAAGVVDRSPEAVFRTAVTWGNINLLPVALGMCPECSAPLEESVEVCSTHTADDGLCPQCDRRYAVLFNGRCPRCLFDESGAFFVRLLANPALRRFLLDHDIDPVVATPEPFFAAVQVYEETVHSHDPFQAQFTFRIDGESLTLTVDEDLTVTETTRS